MTATERPSDVALSIALEKLDQIGMMTKRGRASVSARATAAFIRTQLESAPTNFAEIGSKSVVEPSDGLLGAKHTGMKISAAGILGRIRDGRYHSGLDYGCGVMLGHLEEMAARFYAGDPKVVDEFLQLYDLADARPGDLAQEGE